MPEKHDNVLPVWYRSVRLFWTKLWIIIVHLSVKLVSRTKFPSSTVESFNWDNTFFPLSCCWLVSHIVLELVMTIPNFHKCGTKETIAGGVWPRMQELLNWNKKSFIQFLILIVSEKIAEVISFISIQFLGIIKVTENAASLRKVSVFQAISKGAYWRSSPSKAS